MTAPEIGERALLDLVAAADKGVLTTLKRDGRPQLSMVNYEWRDTAGTVRISSAAARAKVHNLRRDPRVSMLVSSADGWAYCVLEGTATVSAVASDVADDAVAELVDLYRSIRGEHPDWAEYRAAMIADGRLVIRIDVERTYGLPPRTS